jgi:hypothetical protein
MLQIRWTIEMELYFGWNGTDERRLKFGKRIISVRYRWLASPKEDRYFEFKLKIK